MMPRDKPSRYMKWPERHGFSIGGFGPSYVLNIMKGSAAEKQGLKLGDQIIELDNNNVCNMAAPALENFAKHMNSAMPTIKVVNDVQHIELFATRIHRYGLTVEYSQRNGFLIADVIRGSPAERAGLHKGDLVIEVNGEIIYDKADAIHHVQRIMSAHRGKLTLAVLPLTKKRSQTELVNSGSGPNGRGYRDAKVLYSKMNNLFEGSYEKKMAVVGILKRYAENKNTEKLAKALVSVLQTPGHRRILPYIRLHVPIKERRVFDGVIERSIGKSYAEDRLQRHASNGLYDYHQTAAASLHSSNRLNGSTSSLLYLRSTVVHKGDGEMGVVLKGHKPVVIESVLPNKAADRAGVLKGDCLLKINSQSVVHLSHYEVQQILRNAGPSVHLELIQQVHKEEIPELTMSNGRSPLMSYNHSQDYKLDIYDTISSQAPSTASLYSQSPVFQQHSFSSGTNFRKSHKLPDARVDEYTDSTLSSRRTNQSHLSSPWAFGDSLKHGAKGPTSFKTQLNFLLEKQEKKRFKQALLDYNTHRDIKRFCDEVNSILDTNAKKTLWSFLLPIFSSDHEAYVRDNITLPEGVLTTSRRENGAAKPLTQATGSSALEGNGHPPETITSFKYQLEYLLTSKERRDVKRLLQKYKETTNVKQFTTDMNELLDTQSKKALWMHILTLLPASHQAYVRKKIDLPGNTTRSVADSRTAADTNHSRRNRILTQSDDEFFVVSDAQKAPRAPAANTESDDEDYSVDNIKMLKYEAKGSFAQRADQQRFPGADYFMENPIYGSSANSSSQLVARSKSSLLEAGVSDPGISAYDVMTLPQNTTDSYRRGRTNAAFVSNQNPAHNSFPSSSAYQHTDGRAVQNGYDRVDHTRGSYDVTKIEEDKDTDAGIPIEAGHEPTSPQPLSNISHGSDKSFSRQMKQALQAMDDAVAGQNGLETDRQTTDRSDRSQDITQTPPTPDSVPLPPPPPPPPPPIPVPPPLPDSSAPLQVKRLNWETHNPEQLDQTIWARRDSTDHLDIQDMVEYLELAQQFSTVKKKPAPVKANVTSTKRSILQQKKAFNTSIVLASLDIPDVTTAEQRNAYIERSLLRVEVDGDHLGRGQLTPHLLKQLIQFAPDKYELMEYQNYTGDLKDLSEVDQFVYRMTQLPGYIDRLQAILFKSTFDEKCAEVEKQLQVINAASDQVKESKSFAKIVEIVLAMGNELNKATNKPSASAFKVSFLSQLDSTKTVDKKKSFLDVLVQAVFEKFPYLLETSDTLSLVPEAEKISFQDVSKEITELQDVLQQISETINHLTTEQKHYTEHDRFQEVMEHFVNSAEDRIQHLVRLHADTGEKYEALLMYLGEKKSSADSRAIFSIIKTFLTKFDNAHRLYLQRIEEECVSPRSPTSYAAQFISSL